MMSYTSIIITLLYFVIFIGVIGFAIKLMIDYIFKKIKELKESTDD